MSLVKTMPGTKTDKDKMKYILFVLFIVLFIVNECPWDKKALCEKFMACSLKTYILSFARIYLELEVNF